MIRGVSFTHSVRVPSVIAFAALMTIQSGCVSVDTTMVADETSSVDRNWVLVQAYIDIDTAWHAKSREIMTSDDSAEERERRLKEELGEHPDIVLSVVAARSIIEEGGDKSIDAAVFLVEHTPGLSPTVESDQELGLATLQELIGPDWSVVESHKKKAEERSAQTKSIMDSDMTDDEKSEKMSELGMPPMGVPATAAALAIVALGPAHERAQDAAEFLVENGFGGSKVTVAGARALATHFPDYEGWPTLLGRLSSSSIFRQDKVVDEFIAELTTIIEDPVVRAAARYYRGSGMAVGLNDPALTSEERDSKRQEALALATGLSADIEDELFPGSQSEKTLADFEVGLLYRIRHASVGGTVADEAGLRLDGTEDRLSAYSGKVVLVDFWATWCGPCVGALPELRELVTDYADKPFELLAISVDDDVETVTTFMETEPMPWSHWWVDIESELIDNWRVRAYPTYVVVGPDGVIISRNSSLEDTKEVLKQQMEEPATTVTNIVGSSTEPL